VPTNAHHAERSLQSHELRVSTTPLLNRSFRRMSRGDNVSGRRDMAQTDYRWGLHAAPRTQRCLWRISHWCTTCAAVGLAH